MTNICLICGKKMTTRTCECGFDFSKYYDGTRTVSEIPGNQISTYQKHKQREEEHEVFLALTAQADLGDAIAMRKVGDAYNTGKGVNQDYSKAFEWYQKAAASGNAYALRMLSVLHSWGRGTEKSAQKAFECLLEAAQKGVVDAMGELGYDYMNGLGVEKNMDEAIRWLEIGSEKGNTYAKKLLDELKNA